MAPIEKAENALNRRIDRIQAALREAEPETARRFLIQSLVVCIGIGEALKDYVRMIGQYAQGRHGELKPTHDTLTAQHADLLKSGHELLERLKASPADRAIRKEIEIVQRNMAAIQRTLRRGANALQREVAPSIAMIDKLAESVRRLGEADQRDALKRVIKMIVGHARELYLAQPTLEAKDIIDPAAWEKSAGSEINEATDFYEAYARAGYRTILALDVMTMAVSQTPPRTAEEAIHRANESAAARVKAITARLTTS
ncbi:MAG: hypothetical protein Q7S40_13280 [Opitutaceae bacterium]|nr:hypothetical protein [Opitutaceae bacterium]